MAMETGHTSVYFSPANVLIFHSIVEARQFMLDKLASGWTIKYESNERKGIYTVYWGA